MKEKEEIQKFKEEEERGNKRIKRYVEEERGRGGRKRKKKDKYTEKEEDKKRNFSHFIAQPSGQWPSLSLQPQKFVNCERVSYNLVDTLADTRI